jgi:hypothetical protein
LPKERWRRLKLKFRPDRGRCRRLFSVQASTLGGGRSVKKIPMTELQKLRGHYASMVWRKKNPGKIGAPVLVDFVDESNDANFPSTWVDVTGLPGAGQ